MSDTHLDEKEALQTDNRRMKPRRMKPQRKHRVTKPKTLNGEKFVCDTCGKHFARKDNLQMHYKVHTGEKDFMCKICKKKFAHKSSLTVHHRLHTGEKNYECDICGWKFAHKSNLVSHIKTHGNNTRCGRDYFPCEICGEVFRLNGSLTRHKRTHINGTKNMSDITEHIQIQTHPDGVTFLCTLCNKIYLTPAQLKGHIKYKHMTDKSYICEYCGKKFQEIHHLNIHTTIHTGERKFSCGECGKRFSQKSHLRVHVKLHTGEKDFTCEECGKKFFTKSEMKYHVMSHTGEKKFKCEDCGRGYIKKCSLEWHYKTHAHRNTKRVNSKASNEKDDETKSLKRNLRQEDLMDSVTLLDHSTTYKGEKSSLGNLVENNVTELKKIESINEMFPSNDLTNDVLDVKTEDF
ncbi:gastrula zinc finger protein XlCGF57.1-like isoform X2 [Palaemon carinicauda]|uniref:gastrula zinc finger protein XlCGF57.1-like isoform X2 n=1 Tax=Palaemon carinicauda TaxID=392227 RepID=UPI0035B5A4F9